MGINFNILFWAGLIAGIVIGVIGTLLAQWIFGHVSIGIY